MLSSETEDWIRTHGWKFVAIVASVGGLWYAYGWWVRPPAVEYDNLRYVQLLSTALSARNDDWVGKVQEAVEHRYEAGEMSDRERQAFDAILATAAEGNWEKAERACFQLAEAQLHRRREKPASDDHEHEHEPRREMTRS